jgi:hypothetical protein
MDRYSLIRVLGCPGSANGCERMQHLRNMVTSTTALGAIDRKIHQAVPPNRGPCASNHLTASVVGRGGSGPTASAQSMLQVRMREDLRLLRGAGLYLELRSDTERHCIEVLMPGPALMVRRLSGP